MSNDSIQVGLTPEQEDSAWAEYERCGNFAEVARQLQVPYNVIYHTLNRDPIRLHDVQRVRADSVAARWEGIEGKAAKSTSRLLDFMEGIIAHIVACEESGQEMTDLPHWKDGHKMTVLEAMTWLVNNKILETVTKSGFTAAKIAEGMRQVASGGHVGQKALGEASRDVSKVSDEELARMVSELEATGRPLPWGVQQWKDARNSRAGGSPS